MRRVRITLLPVSPAPMITTGTPHGRREVNKSRTSHRANGTAASEKAHARTKTPREPVEISFSRKRELAKRR